MKETLLTLLPQPRIVTAPTLELHRLRLQHRPSCSGNAEQKLPWTPRRLAHLHVCVESDLLAYKMLGSLLTTLFHPLPTRTASIFERDDTHAFSAQASTSHLPTDIDMTDVEMSSLTPPSHKVANLRSHVTDQADELADDSMSNADALAISSSAKAATASQHVRRKRSVLSRKGKRLAHLQSRDLVPSSRNLHSGHPDDDYDEQGSSYSTEGDDSEDEDGAVNQSSGATKRRSKGTPSRIGSMTKYAVNYFLPNAVSPLPQQLAASSSSVHHMDKPELLLGYAQLIFNASILSTFLYLLYHVVRTVQKDVAEKVRSYEMGTSCSLSGPYRFCNTD